MADEANYVFLYFFFTVVCFICLMGFKKHVLYLPPQNVAVISRFRKKRIVSSGDFGKYVFIIPFAEKFVTFNWVQPEKAIYLGKRSCTITSYAVSCDGIPCAVRVLVSFKFVNVQKVMMNTHTPFQEFEIALRTATCRSFEKMPVGELVTATSPAGKSFKKRMAAEADLFAAVKKEMDSIGIAVVSLSVVDIEGIGDFRRLTAEVLDVQRKLFCDYLVTMAENRVVYLVKIYNKLIKECSLTPTEGLKILELACVPYKESVHETKE